MQTTYRKLTNQEVADRIGLTHTSISRLRSGQRVASRETMLAISKEFGIELGDLMIAGQKASEGDTEQWVDLLADAFQVEAPVVEEETSQEG